MPSSLKKEVWWTGLKNPEHSNAYDVCYSLINHSLDMLFLACLWKLTSVWKPSGKNFKHIAKKGLAEMEFWSQFFSLFTGLAHFTLSKHHFDHSRDLVHPHPFMGWSNYELSLELSLKLSKNECTIDSTNPRKIMQNHSYTSS